MTFHTVTFGDAKHGAIVRLYDGRAGALVGLNRSHTQAKVRIGGRHVRIAADLIECVIQRGDELTPSPERHTA